MLGYGLRGVIYWNGIQKTNRHIQFLVRFLFFSWWTESVGICASLNVHNEKNNEAISVWNVFFFSRVQLCSEWHNKKNIESLSLSLSLYTCINFLSLSLLLFVCDGDDDVFDTCSWPREKCGLKVLECCAWLKIYLHIWIGRTMFRLFYAELFIFLLSPSVPATYRQAHRYNSSKAFLLPTNLFRWQWTWYSKWHDYDMNFR